MPISDIYTGSGTSTLSTASQTPVCSLVTGSSVRGFVVGIRVGIGATSYTSGNCLFQLFRVTNAGSIAGGVTTNGTTANDPNAPASTETFMYAGNTYSVAPTGTVSMLWQQELPQTTGSSWEEFPPLGYEYVLNTSAGLALWVTAAGSAVSQTYVYELVWSH